MIKEDMILPAHMHRADTRKLHPPVISALKKKDNGVGRGFGA